MWDRHMDPGPLETEVATAQGDPWGPFILNLWMESGHSKVEERESGQKQAKSKNRSGTQ